MQALVNRVAGTLLGILSLLTVVGVLASPVLVMIFAPGFLHRDPAQFELAAQLLSITFPYLLFVSLVAFIAGILNTYGRFAAASFVPVWLNVVLIVAALLVSPRLEQPVFALAGGVFVAGVLQVLFLLPSLKRIGIVPRPRWGMRDEGVRRIMKLMLPGIFGSSVAQINLLLDTLIASFLVAGSVSWLYYSDRLVEFPLGVFAIALSTVILPSLSRSHANGSSEEFSRTLDWGLRVVLLIGVPATIGLMLLARPMLATLFYYGDFGATDVAMSGLSLMAFAFGLPGFMLIKVLAPAYYSRKDVRTPVRIAVIAMFTNMLLNIVLVVPMVMLGIPGPHAGLALATSLAAWLNASLLYRTLGKQQVFTPQAGWPRLLLQLALAGTVLTAAAAVGRAVDRGLVAVECRRARLAPAVLGAGRCGGLPAGTAHCRRAADEPLALRAAWRLATMAMEFIRGLYNLRPAHRGCVATIGNFDGVHRGHQAVLGQLREQAGRLQLPATLITFEPLPREFFTPQEAPPRLTRLREKVQALQRYGIERVVCLRFDRRLAGLAPEVFIREILVDGMGVRYLVVGDDFRFGKHRAGTFATLHDAGAQYGFEVASMHTFRIGDDRVSSTRVREALAHGDLLTAVAAARASLCHERARRARRQARPHHRLPDGQYLPAPRQFAGGRRIRRRGRGHRGHAGARCGQCRQPAHGRWHPFAAGGAPVRLRGRHLRQIRAGQFSEETARGAALRLLRCPA